MLTASSIFGLLNKAAPSLLGVAKKNYELSKQISLVRLGEGEEFELVKRTRKHLEDVASLQLALGLKEDALERLLSSADFESLARRLLALQWSLKRRRTEQERYDRARAMQVNEDLKQYGALQMREAALKRENDPHETPAISEDILSAMADEAETTLDLNARGQIRSALRKLLIEKAEAPDIPEVTQLATALMEISVMYSAYLWAKSEDFGFYAQDQAVTTANSRILADEIAALGRTISAEVTVSPKTYTDYEAFALKYLNAVGAAHRYMIHPDFSDLPPIQFEDLYVSPSFASAYVIAPQSSDLKTPRRGPDTRPTTTKIPDRISIDELLATSYRIVVIGTPGAGKSTLARKLCNDVNDRNSSQMFGGRTLIPLLVTLREYAVSKKESRCSVIEFAEQCANADFHLRSPSGFFERLLMSGRIFVIFDGLDELLDVADRIDIRNAVQQFAELYPAVPILVTSREVGYDQAPLDRNRFATYRLLPFIQDQIEEYSIKWFRSTPIESANRKTQMTLTFLREARTVPDLCRNPLMLALLCNLYFREHYLPTNRADVYERCANLLFEIWDKWKHILPNVRLDYHIRPIMGSLAYWIYSDIELQKGVTESQLIEKTQEYLKDFIRSAPKAHTHAYDMVKFFNGRAWLFTDTGATTTERLYQFTHQTFLEYFTAEHIVAEAESTDAFVEALVQRIMSRQWPIVTELSFQIQAKRHHKQGADRVLRSLMKKATTLQGSAAVNVAAFCVEISNLLHPTIEVRQAMFATVADALVDGLRGRDTSEPPHDGAVELKPLLQKVLDLPFDGEISGAETFIAALRATLQSKDGTRAATALEIALGMRHEIEKKVRANLCAKNVAKRWNFELDRMVDAASKRLDEFCRLNVQLCCWLWWQRIIPVLSIIKYHGAEALFVAQAFGFEQAGPSLVEYLVPHFKGDLPMTDHSHGALIDLKDSLLSNPDKWNFRSENKDMCLTEGTRRSLGMGGSPSSGERDRAMKLLRELVQRSRSKTDLRSTSKSEIVISEPLTGGSLSTGERQTDTKRDQHTVDTVW